jgi:uncharacterized protein (TIGR03086 family)
MCACEKASERACSLGLGYCTATRRTITCGAGELAGGELFKSDGLTIRKDLAVMTELIVLFRRAIDGFGEHVHSVGKHQWHWPTPCTDWDVRMLVNHVTVEQLWVTPLFDGSSVVDVGGRFDGDQLGEDPPSAWDAAVNASSARFDSPGALNATVLLSSGEKATSEYCWEMTTDALIHSWDLARGLGADEALDAELVELVYERTLPVAEHLHETGLFAPAVPVPADSTVQTRLLALFGRRA